MNFPKSDSRAAGRGDPGRGSQMNQLKSDSWADGRGDPGRGSQMNQLKSDYWANGRGGLGRGSQMQQLKSDSGANGRGDLGRGSRMNPLKSAPLPMGVGAWGASEDSWDEPENLNKSTKIRFLGRWARGARTAYVCVCMYVFMCMYVCIFIYVYNVCSCHFLYVCGLQPRLLNFHTCLRLPVEDSSSQKSERLKEVRRYRSEPMPA